MKEGQFGVKNLDGWRSEVAGLGMNTEQAGGSGSRIWEGPELLGRFSPA